jgi:hypothetical protein
VFDGAPSARKTFAPMKGADHNDLDAVDPESYWEAVDRFTAGLGAK